MKGTCEYVKARYVRLFGSKETVTREIGTHAVIPHKLDQSVHSYHFFSQAHADILHNGETLRMISKEYNVTGIFYPYGELMDVVEAERLYTGHPSTISDDLNDPFSDDLFANIAKGVFPEKVTQVVIRRDGAVRAFLSSRDRIVP